MRLEQALGFKKGAVVMASSDFLGPFALTEGRCYVLEEDASCVNASECNFTIIDDTHQRAEVDSSYFRSR